jgi:lipoprotein signal peptidase
MNDVPAEVGSPALAATPTAPQNAARRSLLFWGAALAILLLDLWTKTLVFEQLGVDPSSYQSIEEFQHSGPRVKQDVLGDKVRFVATLNPGMMWGAFDSHPALLKVVRPLAVLVIFMLLSSIPAAQWSARLALGGILGGALGNIWDSFRYIGVRDFLEVNLKGVPVFSPFPAFNLADSAICVGVAVLALGMLRAPSAAQKSETPAAG